MTEVYERNLGRKQPAETLHGYLMRLLVGPICLVEDLHEGPQPYEIATGLSHWELLNKQRLH